MDQRNDGDFEGVMEEFDLQADTARKRRQERMEEMRRQKKVQEQRRLLITKWAKPVIGVAVLLVAVGFLGGKIISSASKSSVGGSSGIQSEQDEINEITAQLDVGDVTENNALGLPNEETAAGTSTEETDEESKQNINADFKAEETDNTKILGEDIISTNAVLIDVNNNTILSEKAARTSICPASMTKVMTVLVAAEHITDLDDTYTIPIEITDYAYTNDCSTAGFLDGETVTIRDLFYGTILPSGGEAAVSLATYVAGSQEAFVQMMNDKLSELGLSGTAHFTNCVGLYDTDHYCSVYDMAIIMEAAVSNTLCKEVLSAHSYVTSGTMQHPEGITISNWFLRRIEDKECGNMVLCGKTGYVVQSGSCAVSYAEDSNGNGYVCATGNSNSSWRCIYDQVEIYESVLK